MYHWRHEIQSQGPGIDRTPLPDFDSEYEIYPVAYGVCIECDADEWIQSILDIIKQDYIFLQQQNIRFVLFDLHEASKHLYKAAEIFQKAIDRKIYVVTANRKLLEQTNPDVQVVFNDYWKTRMPCRPGPLHYMPKKLFINLTRVARPHRCMLIDKLIEQGLFDEGYNTISNLGYEMTNYVNRTPTSKILEQNFHTLDVPDLINENPNKSVPLQECKKSFVYIATETLVTNERMFFSEKVYKPIAIGMPFMTLGNPGTLAVLRKLGYKTFGNWFNEDYDLDIAIEDRISIIVENLRILHSKSDSELVKMRKEMMPLCRKNLKIYRLHNAQWDLDQAIKDIVR